MTLLPSLVSALFLMIFIVYFFFATYVYHMNETATLNRFFFLVCAALCLWTFGLGLSIISPDENLALFWRRVSAVGRSSAYYLAFIFSLILTENSGILKR